MSTNMNDYFLDIFTKENINIMWENRNSQTDIIPVQSDWPIRNKLNPMNSRNIEIMLESQYGTYFKTLALIESNDLFIPLEFKKIADGLDFLSFNQIMFQREIDVMIGAFSIESLAYAIDAHDELAYYSNCIEFELILSNEGYFQSFVKEEHGLTGLMNSQFDATELNGHPISCFVFNNDNPGVFASYNSINWAQNLSPKRLLQIFNLE